MKPCYIAALLAATLPLWAQIDNGNITGRVTDPSGAAVVGAQVTLTQTETNFETPTVTNQEGIYRALSLKPGAYRITSPRPASKNLSATAWNCASIPLWRWTRNSKSAS